MTKEEMEKKMIYWLRGTPKNSIDNETFTMKWSNVKYLAEYIVEGTLNK